MREGPECGNPGTQLPRLPFGEKVPDGSSVRPPCVRPVGTGPGSALGAPGSPGDATQVARHSRTWISLTYKQAKIKNKFFYLIIFFKISVIYF